MADFSKTFKKALETSAEAVSKAAAVTGKAISKAANASGKAEGKHHEYHGENQKLHMGLHKVFSFSNKNNNVIMRGAKTPKNIITQSCFFVNTFLKNRQDTQIAFCFFDETENFR